MVASFPNMMQGIANKGLDGFYLKIIIATMR